MKIAVVGATGATGRRVLQHALTQGHSVTAVARHPERLSSAEGLSLVRGDVLSPGGLTDALDGVDAVISCIGSEKNFSPGFVRSRGCQRPDELSTSVCPAEGRSDERGARRATIAGRNAAIYWGGLPRMDIKDAQRESRSVFIGGFWGQLVSSVIWLASAALGTWATPKASILTAVIAGFFIFPLTQMLLRLSGRRASLSRENPFNGLGMQVALVLPFSMLLLVPVALYNLNWFFPALMILLGAHYLPFGTLYGMRMFLVLAAILTAEGYLISQFFSRTFSLGAWVGGITLFVFAWLGRSIATREASAVSTN